MKKIKILHLITGLNTGGTELFLLRLLPVLSDFDHIVVSLTNKGQVGQKLEEKNIKIYELKSGKWLSPFAVFIFFKIIKKENPDILSTWLLHADIFGRIFGRLFGVKKIITNARLVLPFKKYWAYIIFTRLTKNLVDFWTANSKTVAEFYIKNIGINKEKIQVIYNGVDVEKFNISINRNEYREKMGISRDDFLVISVCRLSRQKGLDILIKAISLIKEDKIKFFIVGEGEEENRLKKMVNNLKLKNLIFLGNRNDIPQLLKISDLFVLPTRFEGMSNALMEAVVSEIPIITTDIFENRELLNKQLFFRFIPPGNVSFLADALINIYMALKIPGSKYLRNKFQTYSVFNFEITIKKFSNLYRGIQ